MHMLLILLTLCLRKPYGISRLFSIAYAFAGNGCHPGICSEWLLRLRRGARGVLELLQFRRCVAFLRAYAKLPQHLGCCILLGVPHGASLALWSCSRQHASHTTSCSRPGAESIPAPEGRLHRAVWRH